MIARFAGSILSSHGVHARMIILMYHRVLKHRDPLQPDLVDEEEFDRQMSFIARNFNAIRLTEAARCLREGNLLPRSVVITFDDGYRDNYEVALPVLSRYRLPATFFVATGFLDGGIMWNDIVTETVRSRAGSDMDLSGIGLGCHSLADSSARIRAIGSLIGRLKYEPARERQELVCRLSEVAGRRLPEDLMMSSWQVRGLHEQGMEIGGHTHSHPILGRITLQDAESEVVEGRKRLEEIAGTEISAFAYPNGKPGKDYLRQHVDLLEKYGFECAVSTSWGCATRSSDILQLPRIAPWGRTVTAYAVRMLRAYRQDRAKYL